MTKMPTNAIRPTKVIVIIALYTLLTHHGHAASQTQTAPIDLTRQTLPAAVQACFNDTNREPVVAENCLAASHLELPRELQAQIYAMLAWQNQKLGQGEVNEYIKLAQTGAGTNVVVKTSLGNIALLRGEFDAAMLAYSEALAQVEDPMEAAILHLNRSIAQRALGQFEGAASDYKTYLEIFNRPLPTTQLLDPEG